MNTNTNRQRGGSTVHISLADWIIDDEDSEPQYAISVVAARSGVGRSMLLRYEEWGLIEPARTGRQRLYSEADIEQAMRVRRLMDELGINLAGAAAVLHLRQQVISLQREMDHLRSRLES
jgi:MerR family transcriptional regulator, heat shock protein HspR